MTQSHAPEQGEGELLPLIPDISGDDLPPRPVAHPGGIACECCGVKPQRLWLGRPGDVGVCTLCWLTQNLDSATAAHGHLVWLPDARPADLQNLQRRALIALRSEQRTTRAEGKRIWNWMARHAREVESMWGTSRASEFAAAMHRLTPGRRSQMQQRLEGCVLILPHDVFDDLTVLLPAGKNPTAAVRTPCWGTYTRSNLYAKPPHPLD
ncbi:conjugal transfer protein [Rahnella sp. BCC 1045]|uniref:conjugal transfer protein n=1 Tax=Rahnella sp. BCC 1045 TaxID=2816251 RepID=UPI001C25E4F4|nr:conjugal transfer protein [Rahnella sp. BCC 1045]MBU9819659.1 conjugal transfer protein [Rahnella sp. BCC 1045]